MRNLVICAVTAGVSFSVMIADTARRFEKSIRAEGKRFTKLDLETMFGAKADLEAAQAKQRETARAVEWSPTTESYVNRVTRARESGGLSR